MQAGERSFSLSYYTVPELTFAQMIDVAAAAGCSQVGVRLLDAAPDGVTTPLLDCSLLRREVFDRMESAGIKALEASAARIRPATKVPAFEPFLVACEELGVQHVMCTIDDPERDRACERLADLCRRAREHGLRVEIEFVPWMTVGSLPEAAALVHSVGADNLGIVVDALHFDRSHGCVDDLRKVPSGLLRMVQLCDAPACTDYSAPAQLHVATQERLFPGEGTIALAAILAALPRHIPIALEIPTTKLAVSVPALSRVKRAVAATRAILAVVEGMPGRLD